MEFEWTNGRVLSQITVNPADPNGTADVYSYTYDESGIRSSKTINGVTTYFTTKDGVILSQTDGTNTMYFQYDNSGNPTGFLYNGTQYFYLTNQMGDVIGITDNTGSLVATYTYGAWGEVLAVTPATAGSAAQLSVANANPLRYRGYYLDQETGYYYLQSRYYNPSIMRFANSDLLELASIEKANGTGANLFSYCYNSPTNDRDLDGTFAPNLIIGALFGAIIGAISGLLGELIDNFIRTRKISFKGVKWRNVLINAVAGAVSGLLSYSSMKKLAIRTIYACVSGLSAYATGARVFDAFLIAIIMFVLTNSNGYGSQLRRFSKKASNAIAHTKKLSRANVRKLASAIANAIRYYFKSNKTLYKRIRGPFLRTSFRDWLIAYNLSKLSYRRK